MQTAPCSTLLSTQPSPLTQFRYPHPRKNPASSPYITHQYFMKPHNTPLSPLLPSPSHHHLIPTAKRLSPSPIHTAAPSPIFKPSSDPSSPSPHTPTPPPPRPSHANSTAHSSLALFLPHLDYRQDHRHGGRFGRSRSFGGLDERRRRMIVGWRWRRTCLCSWRKVGVSGW